jgi:hypothetical protein
MSSTNAIHASALTIEEARALPALNGRDVIIRVFQISESHFHRLNAEGAFDFLKVKPSITSKCFSGALIAQYVAGELVGRTFGHRRRA